MFRLDVNNTFVSLNGTNFDNGPTLLWSMDNLQDGDHQLFVTIGSLEQGGFLAVDYFEYVVPLLLFVTCITFQQPFCFQG